MAISGQQTINIGLPNESANSDSLYTAFNKTQTNFTTLFNNSSPYNNFNAGTGISVSSNANTGNVTITNTGVTEIIAGTNIVVGSSNGQVTISTTGGGGSGGNGTVTSVGLLSANINRLTVTPNTAIVSSGNFTIDLATVGNANIAGNYTNPNITVDNYGRITSVANNTVAGTVTSIGFIPGNGISVAGGPITSNGNITITNTGVTRLTAGTGITLSGSNGEVTVSAPVSGGTVTSVAVGSTSLVITGSPIVGAGTISVNLPNSISLSGTLTASNISVNNTVTANILKSRANTFSELPTALAAGAGARSFITDGNTATFNNIVGSGGSNAIPVFSDGTNWRVG